MWSGTTTRSLNDVCEESLEEDTIKTKKTSYKLIQDSEDTLNIYVYTQRKRENERINAI